MATTTNYGWTTPNDTDLVKDGAAAIRTLGSSIDTTTKNLNPETTTGDIAYRSATANTNTRLAIGSSGQVLTVAAGVPSWATPSTFTSPLTTKGDIYTRSASADTRLPVGTNGHTLVADSAEATGLKWAAPGGASGLTFISRTAFTNVSSQAIDDVFTSTYDNYVVIVEDFYGVGSSADDLQMQMRYGSTTQTGNVYNGNSINSARSTTTLTNTSMDDVNPFTIALNSGDVNQRSALTINFTNVGNASENARFYGIGHIGATNYGAVWFGGGVFANQTYTGFLFKTSSGNITGVVTVYGLAKA
jgi:hypothetical protein